VLAGRPATLWAAVSPVLVGSALAQRDEVFAWGPFLAVTAAALLIQIGVNFANDLSDAHRGADDERRVGPPRAVADGLVTPSEMKRAIAVVFGLAVVIGVYLISVAGPVILVIGVVSIVAALGYTGGPLPYGYRALGETFVFVFFGLVATVGTRFVYDRTAPLDAWVGGVVMGLLATAILVANNLRDIETDAATGKRTLAVRLGVDRTRTLYAATVGAPFLVVAVAAVAGWIPPWSALAVLALPLVVPLVRTVRAGARDRDLIAVLVGTAQAQLAVAVLFSAGALL
jgi:1,4-dihydroxy-2-naphthoate octaprenyltransferase